MVLAALASSPDIELFTREGCPHCVEAHEVVQELVAERGVTVEFRDVVKDAAARERLKVLSEAAGVTTPGVPAFYVRGQLIVGIRDRESGLARVRAALDAPASTAGTASAGDEHGDGTCGLEETVDEACAPPAEETGLPDGVTLPFFGHISARSLGLPLFTLIIGLVDGFNPCATWVLLFLLSFLVNLKSRPRMAIIGSTFVLVSGIVYFAFMAAWLSFFFVVGISKIVTVILGAVAVLVGAVNVKDYFAFGRGFSLSIPDKAKPKIYARARRILNADNLGGALVAVIGLAFLVNLVELLCTAGLPAVYTAVLASHDLSRPAYYGYLGLYNAAYIADDSLLLCIAVVTLSKHKLQEKGGRILKLVSGSVMLGLGLTLLIKPEWLGW